MTTYVPCGGVVCFCRRAAKAVDDGSSGEDEALACTSILTPLETRVFCA